MPSSAPVTAVSIVASAYCGVSKVVGTQSFLRARLLKRYNPVIKPMMESLLTLQRIIGCWPLWRTQCWVFGRISLEVMSRDEIIRIFQAVRWWNKLNQIRVGCFRDMIINDLRVFRFDPGCPHQRGHHAFCGNGKTLCLTFVGYLDQFQVEM